ncbi:type VII secretion protein EccE [Dactylosporangium darangshiense]|uniref:Type VII secretion system protein EccE domain-containing protein n=1 Tax=Dactylosporangium darangshiense TaxID=579108 RepID=A0ABP8DCL8_9ACTN
MTETATGVRAVARVGSTSQPPPGTPEMRPAKRSGQLGPVHILQLLVVEALVVTAVALLGQGVLVALPVALVAAVLCIAVLARSRGRWWLEQWRITRMFRHRRAARPAGGPADELADLHLLAPGLSITELGRAGAARDSSETTDLGQLARDGEQAPDAEAHAVVAVARDPAGWYAVAEIEPTTVMADQPTSPVPLPMLARTLAATGQAGVLLQVVTQASPATSPAVQPPPQAARSYQDLLKEIGSGPAPVNRVSWLVVRLEEHRLAVAGADGDVHERAPVVVAALLRRAVHTLQRVGLSAGPLDRPALLAALRQGCGLPGGPEGPHEEWNGWHSGHLVHSCFWISEWPAPPRVPALLQRLATIPAMQTTVATIVAVPPADLEADVLDAPLGEAELRCLVRVATTSDRLADAQSAVVRSAEELGAQVQRLDGEQAPAVYATAPTGGGRW